MRTPLILALSLALHTAAFAQSNSNLLANRTEPGSTAAPLAPAAYNPEARASITQVMETELQAPDLQKRNPRIVFIDVKDTAATARVDYGRAMTHYYHLRQTDGQWRVIKRDNDYRVHP